VGIETTQVRDFTRSGEEGSMTNPRFAPGTQVGPYRIVAPLAEGGIGTVLRAEHVEIRRPVAIKILRSENARRDHVNRLVAEARAANQIRHEHIVEVTDLGRTAEGDVFLVMELLDGESVAERLAQQGPLSVERTLRIGIQVASALSAAHAAGILHRDVKPANLLLIRRGDDPDYVKVVDFGLAKWTELTAPAVTRTGAVFGTPSYMSPEQCLGVAEIDGRSDIYSLGIVLFELLAGDVPFRAQGLGGVLLQHLQAPLPSLEALRPDVPASVVSLIERAAAKQVEDRWQDMDALHRALHDELARLRGVPATSVMLAAADGGSGSSNRATTREPTLLHQPRPPARSLRPSTSRPPSVSGARVSSRPSVTELARAVRRRMRAPGTGSRLLQGAVAGLTVAVLVGLALPGRAVLLPASPARPAAAARPALASNPGALAMKVVTLPAAGAARTAPSPVPVPLPPAIAAEPVAASAPPLPDPVAVRGPGPVVSAVAAPPAAAAAPSARTRSVRPAASPPAKPAGRRDRPRAPAATPATYEPHVAPTGDEVW
jgi:serine/threonine-protein kinase